MLQFRRKLVFTIKLLLILLLSTIFIRIVGVLFEKEISSYLILYPSNVNEPLNWYRLLTYPLDNNGLFNWIRIASVILPAGYIIEQRTDKKNLVAIIFISIILGGLLFIIINGNDGLNRPVASAGLLAWGFWAAAIACGIKNWKDINVIEKIIVIVLLMGVFKFNHFNFGYLIAQIGVVLAILAYVFISGSFNKKAIEDNTLTTAG